MPIPAELPKDHTQYYEPPAVVRPAEAEVLQQRDLFSATIRAVARPVQDVVQPWVQIGERAVEAGRTKLAEVMKQLNPPLTEKELRAAKYIHAMLEPQRLGGEDRTFNHRDVPAVVEGVKDGSAYATIAAIALENKLPESLTEAGVIEDKTAEPDMTERTVTVRQLQNMEKAQKILEPRSARLRKFGLDVQFPGGISQAAMQHLIDGKPGIPPGGKLVIIPPSND